MPASPPGRGSSFIRLPKFQAANLTDRQLCAAVLPEARAHVSSPAQPWAFPATEELPTATVACLKVLDQLLLETSPAAASAFDSTENLDDAEDGPQSRGGDSTSSRHPGNADRDAGNETEAVVHSGSNHRKRSRDTCVTHAERMFVATDGSVEVEESSRGRETRDRRIVKSYASIFKVLHTAGVLNTLPKCLHMLHAVCILADQQQRVGMPVPASLQACLPDTFSCSPKRQKLEVDGRVVVETVGDAVHAHECGGCPSNKCDPNTDSRGLDGQGDVTCQLAAAALSPEYVMSEHGHNAEGVFCSSGGRKSACESEARSVPTDCTSSAMCCPLWASTRDFSGDRRKTIHSTIHGHARTAHIAGLVLGHIEALGAPPEISDPRFHEKVVHVLSRLFYARQPLEGGESTPLDASTILPAMLDSEGSGDAALSASDLSNMKSTGGFDGVANRALDAFGEGRRWGPIASHETTLEPLSPQKWRQHIIARFDTVERLLLCSAPVLFLDQTPTVSARKKVSPNGEFAARSMNDVTGGNKAGKDPLADEGDVDACVGGPATTKATVEGDMDLDKNGVDKGHGHTDSALKGAASAAVIVQGRERCRRALRTVRHWVAFLLELEQERQNLVKRVLQASEEVQGLPHMLLQDSFESEQQEHELNLNKPGSGCLTRRKRRRLLILRSSKEGGATQEYHKHGLDKKAGWIGGGIGQPSEQLEIRIRATQQLLLLPSLPPFTRPEGEIVRAARARFERCLLRWREAQDRRRQEEEEARKKAAAAAAAVVYVTDRMQEQQQAQAAAYSAPPGTAAAATALLRLRSISHAFYLLGLNPQTATSQTVEQVRKKWRVLLHPDKFVSVHPHLLQQATEAFKAFHLAVTEANRLLSQRRVEPSWSPPPPPPDLTSGAHAGAAVAAPASGAAAVYQSAHSEPQQTPVKGSADAAAATASCEENPRTKTHESCCHLPTHQFFPEVTVQVSRSKKKACTGGLVLHVHAAPFREGEWPFAVIKEVRIFVLRPTLAEGALWKLLPSTADVCFLLKKSVELKCTFSTATEKLDGSPVAADKNTACPTTKVEIHALQPIELGVEKVYWVGVQVEGLRKSHSLVTWKPVTVCLALPEGADSNAPPHSNDSCNSSSASEGGATASEPNVGSRGFPAACRVILAFLQTFTASAFVKDDCSFNDRLRDAIASLKRVLRQHKRNKRSEGAHRCCQDTEEWKWVEHEAKQVLRECMERAKTWESAQDTKPSTSATG